jgi:XTP/dITP diphosphohydrolase
MPTTTPAPAPKPLTPLIIASHNEGKVREFRELLAPLGFKVSSAAELGLDEPEETGNTFEANASLKARAAEQAFGTLALADDSGLVVPALDGAPGIYSARWAGLDKDFGKAIKRVEQELIELGYEPEGTQAYFVCVLALAYPEREVRTIRGEVHGTLTFPPRGERGFGYDPIFIPDGYAQTFGQMHPDAKNKMSHRAVAFQRLRDYMEKDYAA